MFDVVRFAFIFCEFDFVRWPHNIKFNSSIYVWLGSIEFENRTFDVIRRVSVLFARVSWRRSRDLRAGEKNEARKVSLLAGLIKCYSIYLSDPLREGTFFLGGEGWGLRGEGHQWKWAPKGEGHTSCDSGIVSSVFCCWLSAAWSPESFSSEELLVDPTVRSTLSEM